MGKEKKKYGKKINFGKSKRTLDTDYSMQD
jgi:hypothetical protein